MKYVAFSQGKSCYKLKYTGRGLYRGEWKTSLVPGYYGVHFHTLHNMKYSVYNFTCILALRM